MYGIDMQYKSVEDASCGDNVYIHVKGLKQENMPRIGNIMVIDDKDIDPDTPRAVKSFTTLVFV